ncbi:MAG: cytochrome c family protein [Hyphomonadaceae bacterium]|nr:cytochrome c family protein [Hyphomonadaceae bacterium]
MIVWLIDQGLPCGAWTRKSKPRDTPPRLAGWPAHAISRREVEQGRAMSDLRMNSVFGAVLASVLGVMAVGVAADAIIEPHYPEKAAFLPEVEVDTGGGGPAAPAGPPDFGTLFADPTALAELVARGERVRAQCVSCHTFDAGGAEGIGPNLHDAFGRVPGSHPGYSFSEAMTGHGGIWDYLQLNDFLTSPARDTPGTKMAFAGIRNEQDRVAIIAYMRSISPNAVPLPAPLPVAAPAEGEAEPAEGEAAPAATPG